MGLLAQLEHKLIPPRADADTCNWGPPLAAAIAKTLLALVLLMELLQLSWLRASVSGALHYTPRNLVLSWRAGHSNGSWLSLLSCLLSLSPS